MNKTRLTCNKNKTIHAGFTLLELVLVLFLLTLMASATLFLTENVDSQAKYDETKRRMEIIRQAIVGDPTRRLNGQTEISGFAADMGRLPGCIRELVEQNHCIDASGALAAWTIDPNTGLGSGWRGPYIQVAPESNGALRFRDGHLNTATDASGVAGTNSDASTNGDEEKNHGWSWALYDESDVLTADASTAESIKIQSYAQDGSTKYPQGSFNSFSPLVSRNDWKIALPDPISIVINNTSSTAIPVGDESLSLLIYKTNLSAFIDTLDLSSNTFKQVASGAIASTTNGSIAFEISDTALPIGKYAYSIVCFDGAEPDATKHLIFDGDCDTATKTQSIETIRYFTVAPRQNLTLEWTVP